MCFLFEKYPALNQSEFPHPLHTETWENYEYMHIMSNIVCGVQNRVGMHEKHKLTLILPMIVVFLNKDILISIEHLRTVKEG